MPLVGQSSLNTSTFASPAVIKYILTLESNSRNCLGTTLASVLIFATIEKGLKWLMSFPKYENFIERIKKKRKNNLSISNYERVRSILFAMFIFLLSNILLVIVGIEAVKLFGIPLSRYLFVASLICLIFRIYLHGKRAKR